MRRKIRAAIIGYGNIGNFALSTLKSTSDFTVAGIVRRNMDISSFPPDYPVVTSIEQLEEVDVALLCVPSRLIPEFAESILRLGINVVDSFDIHPEINALRQKLDLVAKQSQAVAITAAGWDPGSDSIIRTLMLAMAPRGLTYTNFGPGMSMGHSVIAKSIDGVKEALAITIPLGTGIHRRLVYVELSPEADFENVQYLLKQDPYFSKDETHIVMVENVAQLKDMGHGVLMTHQGVSGNTHNQYFEFSMKINNPALTSQFMVSAARASMRQKPGAYTVIEIPPVDFLVGERAEWIDKLV